MSAEELKKFDGDLVDIGFPLNFVNGEDFFNVVTGPMEKGQSQQFFGNDEDLPQAAIYIDVDYFRRDISSDLKQRNILKFIDTGVNKAKGIADTIASLVNENK